MQDIHELQEQHLAFSVDAPGLVQFARDLVLENKWRKAVQVLRSISTPSLPLDLVEAVLQGRMTLASTEQGVQVRPQDPDESHCKRYLATARWQTAGMLDDQGAFYQPYAVIQGFGPEDEEHAVRTLREREDTTSLREYRKLRAQFHVRHPQSDRIEFGLGKAVVVFERAKDPALWVETFEDAAGAWSDYCQHRKSSLSSLGEPSAATGQPCCAGPRSWEFYLRAVLEGVVYLSHNDRDVLPKQEREVLEQALALREAFEERVAELDEGSPEFDGLGRQITAERLLEDLRKEVYTLMYTTRVHRQAERCGGYFELPVQDHEGSYSLRVALAPFLQWARHRPGHATESKLGGIPTWVPVFPSGSKMQGDDPLHTDWWASAGLPLQAAYSTDHPVNRAAWRFRYHEAVNTGASFVKLAGSGVVTGPVVFPKAGQAVPAGSIAVVPNAGVDYQQALFSACKDASAGAVIAAVGGKLAHLAVVSREINGRLVVVDGALERFEEGQLVRLDLEQLSLQVLRPEDD